MHLYKIFKPVLLAILGVFCGVISAPTPSCTDPTDLQTRFLNLNRGLDYRTLFFTEGWKNDTLEQDFQNLVFQGIDKVYTSCPSTFLKGNFPLMIRTACPWYLEKVAVDDRFPREIYTANTKCSGCIGSNGLQKCERIYSQIMTLKRTGCSNGVYQYEARNEAIPVAFACAQQREVQSSIQVSSPPAVAGPEPM